MRSRLYIWIAVGIVISQIAFVYSAILFSKERANDFIQLHSEQEARDFSVLSQHAQELMGQTYFKSRPNFRTARLERALTLFLKVIMKNRPHGEARKMARSILSESRRFGMDPFFILAIIQRESRFNPNAIGSHGEIGLMQIRPTTADWIGSKFGIQDTEKSALKDPVKNIRIGTAYMAFLRESFNKRAKLYLAAYNMGPSRVRQFARANIVPNEYANYVLGHYKTLHNLFSSTN